MRGRQPIVILAALLGVAACGAGDGGGTAEASEEPPAAAAVPAEEARIELIEADRALARATAERGEDGRVALRWTPSRAEVSEDATLGWTEGPLEIVALEPAPGDPAVLAHGTYLTVWARQDDESWKVLADIGGPAR